MESTPTLSLTQGPAQGVAPRLTYGGRWSHRGKAGASDPCAHPGLALPDGCGLGRASAGFGKQGWAAWRAWAMLMLIESACWLGLRKGFPSCFHNEMFYGTKYPLLAIGAGL